MTRLIRIGRFGLASQLGVAVPLLFLLLAAIPGFAQSQACTTFAANTPQLRAEGFTELIGDILVKCTGGIPTPKGQNIPQGNFTVYLNAPVTSRVLNPTASGLESLLLIDDPSSANQKLCTSLNGCAVLGNPPEPFNGSSGGQNTFQAVLFTSNSIVFQGVPIDPPGPGVYRTYRIVNVRVNANSFAPSGVPVQVVANVLATLPLQNTNPAAIVGTVSSGLSFGGGAVSVSQCGGAVTNQLAYFVFSENFPAAFKARGSGSAQNQFPFVYNSESGFVFSQLPGSGSADFGTRFKIVIRNVPSGVTLWVSTGNIAFTPTASAQLIGSETGPYGPIGGGTPIDGIPAVPLTIVNGAATAIWEVTAADSTMLDTFYFGVFVTTSGPLALNTIPMTVNGSFAPVSPSFVLADGQSDLFALQDATASPTTLPIPRFADTSSPQDMLAVMACQTNLLFTFVTNQAKYDTALVLSNTSADPFGTTQQSGTCTLNFYGNNPPQAATTPAIHAGTVYSTYVSAIAPGFGGYVIAVCNFQYAHGLAFIMSGGSTHQSPVYPALVIPYGVRSPADASLGAIAGSGEALNQ